MQNRGERGEGKTEEKLKIMNLPFLGQLPLRSCWKAARMLRPWQLDGASEKIKPVVCGFPRVCT